MHPVAKMVCLLVLIPMLVSCGSDAKPRSPSKETLAARAKAQAQTAEKPSQKRQIQGTEIVRPEDYLLCTRASETLSSEAAHIPTDDPRHSIQLCKARARHACRARGYTTLVSLDRANIAQTVVELREYITNEITFTLNVISVSNSDFVPGQGDRGEVITQVLHSVLCANPLSAPLTEQVVSPSGVLPSPSPENESDSDTDSDVGGEASGEIPIAQALAGDQVTSSDQASLQVPTQPPTTLLDRVNDVVDSWVETWIGGLYFYGG